MRYKPLIPVFFLFIPFLSGQYINYDPVLLANPLMGTDSEFSLSNGNTYPAIAVPWGMNFWTPQTNKMGDGWCYRYDDYKLRGFKQTHQPSPWLNDYGAFSIFPLTGNLVIDEDKRASWFSHKAEKAFPHFYEVYLADYDVKVEFSPTERAAYFNFTFPESDSSYILLDAFFKGSMVEIFPDQRKIIGYSRNAQGGVPDNFHNYFVVEIDTEFESYMTWEDNWQIKDEDLKAKGEHVGAILKFKTQKNQQIGVKVASSFISPAQAQLNLNREIGDNNFLEVKRLAYQKWKDEFAKFKIKSKDQESIKTFFSCLYRVLLFPRSFYELDSNNEIYHYSPYNGKVLPGYMFTDNGFWDTFRAVFPFFSLMYPDLNAKIMEGLVNTYKESGWLPEWASPGHRDVMIGSNSAVIISDAYAKGVENMDIETLLEAILKNANEEENRPVKSVGREGVNFYNKQGYVPYNVGINESAARTLEYAFADFNIGQIYSSLGNKSEAEKYYGKSLNYKNLFDPSHNLMRGKNEDGTFQKPFNPFKWGDAFTEGNSWHYSWSVFHDMDGLIQLMGGEDIFVEMLDSVFIMPPIFDESYYGFIIHEIREMQIMGMGQYAHGNQPIQHMPYLFNYGKQPWKSQFWVREIMDRMYSSAPDGYCGDEDNGQTSAWYVFSALGFYPVCPGTDEYILGSPLFEEIDITLPNNNQLKIMASHNTLKNRYIHSARINEKNLKTNFITHKQLINGGLLHFDMTEKPNLFRGIIEEAKPFSLSRKK